MLSSNMALLEELLREFFWIPCLQRCHLLFRVGANAIDRLPFQPDSLGHGRKTNSLVQKLTRAKKLLTRKCRLSSSIFRAVIGRLNIGDACPLSLLRRFGIGFFHFCYECKLRR